MCRANNDLGMGEEKPDVCVSGGLRGKVTSFNGEDDGIAHEIESRFTATTEASIDWRRHNGTSYPVLVLDTETTDIEISFIDRDASMINFANWLLNEIDG